MTDVVDSDIIVLAPEKRYSLESLAHSQHILSGGLPLALGDNPVFHADPLPGMGVRPARRIARGKDSGSTGFKVLIDQDSAIHCQTRSLRQHNRRPHANSQYEEVSLDRPSATQLHLLRSDA